MNKLPRTVEGCDKELRDAAQALSVVSARSRQMTMDRIDLLLDRRLMLTYAVNAEELLSPSAS